MGALLFAALAVSAVFVDSFPGDERIAGPVHDIDVPAFAGFIDAVNALGYWWAYFPLMLALAFAFAMMRAGWESILLLATSALVGLNTLLKDWIGRPRPSSPGDAFPSGHTVATAALFGVLFLVLPAVVPVRWLRWPLQAGCLLMVAAAGPARVYVDAHSPSDVFAAYLLVVLFLAPVFAAYWRLKPRPAKKLTESDAPA
ncbi:MAG: phosphatase PAP2 family protein [Dehalococcoidia bacterium]